MPAVDRALLRLGTFELRWGDDVAPAVAIDEAVELAKELSTDESPAFVNGVLGRIAAADLSRRRLRERRCTRSGGTPMALILCTSAGVPREGLEPSCLSATDFESAASASSATGAPPACEAREVY